MLFHIDSSERLMYFKDAISLVSDIVNLETSSHIFSFFWDIFFADVLSN
jgi:hypothetical protein